MVVAHFKDRFLQPSETFIFALIQSLERTRSIILDRHLPQNPEQYLHWPHFSPAAQWGRPMGWVERASLRLFGRSPYLERVLHSEKVQIVHAHFGQLGATIAPVTQRLKLPLVTSFYGKDVSVFARSPTWERRFQHLWRSGSAFLAVGCWMKSQLVSLGCPEDKLAILPLPLDFSPAQPGESVGVPEGPFKILSVGRLIPKKGMDILIHAAALLPRDPPWVVYIAGDGPLLSDLQALAKTLKVEDRVVLTGWLDRKEVHRLMMSAHSFVLAARTDPGTGETEGSPTVLLEAQAAGLPVVSTFHADIPSIVIQEESGLLVPESSPEGIASSIRRLMADPSLRFRLARSGRSLVEQRHNMQTVGAQLEALYRQLLRDFRA